MRKFTTEELTKFLEQIDTHLTHPHEIVILGGAALSLGYDHRYRTHDIDLFKRPSKEILRACELAQAETGLRIHLAHSTVSETPYNADEREQSILTYLKHLQVKVLDYHDLALSKTIRGERKDLDALQLAHEQHPFDENILIERYTKEMNEVIGDKRRIDQNFINLIDHLYGPMEADRVRTILPGWTPIQKRKATKNRHRAPKKK